MSYFSSHSAAFVAQRTKAVNVAGSTTIDIQSVAQAGAPKKMVKRYVGLDNKLPPIRVDGDENAFRAFIIDQFTKVGYKRAEAERWTDKAGMTRFILAMTHSSVNPTDPSANYEMMEHLGDATIGKSTTWYLSRRFPHLVKEGNRGVQYLSKQKSLITSKAYLADFCQQIGLDRFIRFRALQFTYSKGDKPGSGEEKQAPVYKTVTKDRSMLEDTFEAFVAAIEEVVDSHEDTSGPGIGYRVAYDWWTSILDKQEIPISLNELVDAKTQLKEIFDKRQARFGDKISWDVNDKTRELWVKMYFTQSPDGKDKEVVDLNLGPYSLTVSRVGEDDYATSKKVVEQQASRDTLNYLQAKYGQQFVRYTGGE